MDFQKILDIYYEIGSNLDGPSLISYCEINNLSYETCLSEKFWMFIINRINHYSLQQLFIDLVYEDRLAYLKLLISAVNKSNKIIDARTMIKSYMITAENQNEEIALYIRNISKNNDHRFNFHENIVPMYKEIIILIDNIRNQEDVFEIEEYFVNMSAFYNKEWISDLIIDELKNEEYNYLLESNEILDINNYILSSIAKKKNYNIIIKYLNILKDLNPHMEEIFKEKIISHCPLQLIDKIPLKYNIYNNGESINGSIYNRNTYMFCLKIAPLNCILYSYVIIDPKEWVNLSLDIIDKDGYKVVINNAKHHGYTYWYKKVIKILQDKGIYI